MALRAGEGLPSDLRGTIWANGGVNTDIVEDEFEDHADREKCCAGNEYRHHSFIYFGIFRGSVERQWPLHRLVAFHNPFRPTLCGTSRSLEVGED